MCRRRVTMTMEPDLPGQPQVLCVVVAVGKPSRALCGRTRYTTGGDPRWATATLMNGTRTHGHRCSYRRSGTARYVANSHRIGLTSNTAINSQSE